LKSRVLTNSEQYLCPYPHQKNVEYSARSGDLVDVENILLGSSEYALRVLELESVLLHCNASNLVLEIWKNDKI